MKAAWSALPAAFLLGSPFPPVPPPPLAYDLDAGEQWCAGPAAATCGNVSLAGGPSPLLPPSPPPPLTGPVTQGLRIVVSLKAQRLYVFEDGALVASSPVSTGKRGHGTPTGTFRVLEKRVRHRSNLYSNAPMPYMQRLTMGGVALHAGALPGYPASHGCIRMPHGFARRLFAMTSRMSTVTVVRDRPKNAEAAFGFARTI